MKYTAKNQSESFADYMTAIPDDLRPDFLKGIDSILEMEDAIENATDDQYQEAMRAFEDAMDNATVEDVVLNGRYDNAFMRLADADGDVVHQNMELVRCTTTENGTNATKFILHNAKDGSVVGDFIAKANVTDATEGSEEKDGDCTQVVHEVGSKATQGMPEIREDPEHPGPHGQRSHEGRLRPGG